MFRTGSKKKIEFRDIPEAILRFYRAHEKYDSLCRIIIGTDSQNFSDTKMVTVIAVICEGHGGIFFYQISRKRLIRDVRQKLHVETMDSLMVAEQLVTELAERERYQELFLSCPVSIHVDAGNSEKGKTRQLIPELVGWIRACGYEASVKPESFVASTIADRISK